MCYIVPTCINLNLDNYFTLNCRDLFIYFEYLKSTLNPVDIHRKSNVWWGGSSSSKRCSRKSSIHRWLVVCYTYLYYVLFNNVRNCVSLLHTFVVMWIQRIFYCIFSLYYYLFYIYFQFFCMCVYILNSQISKSNDPKWHACAVSPWLYTYIVEYTVTGYIEWFSYNGCDACRSTAGQTNAQYKFNKYTPVRYKIFVFSQPFLFWCAYSFAKTFNPLCIIILIFLFLKSVGFGYTYRIELRKL